MLSKQEELKQLQVEVVVCAPGGHYYHGWLSDKTPGGQWRVLVYGESSKNQPKIKRKKKESDYYYYIAHSEWIRVI